MAPGEHDIRQAPAWLVARLRRRTPAPSAAISDALPRLVEGNRNTALASLAGAMRVRGMSVEAIRAALLEENRARCDPPLDDREVEKIAESISRYPSGGSKVVGGGGLFSHNSLFSPADEPEWPAPPSDTVFTGLAGEIVHALAEHTEADPIAILANLLVGVGSIVGTGPHFMVGATKHHPREFVALVGRTSKARKGDSLPGVRRVLELAAPDWGSRIVGGLSTGEGLIHTVRDPVEKQEPIKEKGLITGYQKVVVDEGVADKRLFVIEPELARVLRVMERQGNSLSPVLRAAWDSGDLAVLTRANSIHATGAHISLVGHITKEELERELPDVEAANGFGNRFMWLAVRRSRLLAEPVPFSDDDARRLAFDLGQALGRALGVREMTRDEEARRLWIDVYEELTAERDGLVGSLTARAEAHVLRLSMLYALLDGTATIQLLHLTAALELWAYSARSLEYLFGNASGDPVADVILRALMTSGPLRRTEISALFGRHESAARIEQGLRHLARRGWAVPTTEDTGGRPVEIWRATA